MATHPIRILSIGIHGLPNGEIDNFASANVLQDYDAVVVCAKSIESLFGGFNIEYRNHENLILDDDTGKLLPGQSLKRRY